MLGGHDENWKRFLKTCISDVILVGIIKGPLGHSCIKGGIRCHMITCYYRLGLCVIYDDGFWRGHVVSSLLLGKVGTLLPDRPAEAFQSKSAQVPPCVINKIKYRFKFIF